MDRRISSIGEIQETAGFNANCGIFSLLANPHLRPSSTNPVSSNPSKSMSERSPRSNGAERSDLSPVSVFHPRTSIMVNSSASAMVGWTRSAAGTLWELATTSNEAAWVNEFGSPCTRNPDGGTAVLIWTPGTSSITTRASHIVERSLIISIVRSDRSVARDCWIS